MSWPAPNTFVTFCKGLTLPTVSAVFTEAGRPALATGESSGWAWVTHDAYSIPVGASIGGLARDITGYRHADRVSHPDRVESVFLASTPACECPHGQNYMVPHCAEHPCQFTYSRGGFVETCFNIGRRRESRRAGGMADLLVRELLDAGIVGRDVPKYDTDPGFNADGAHTVRIIADHFGLPSPPLGLGPAGSSTAAAAGPQP
ncbi:hypothetical protein OG369_23345 [Streptomyces sp. NBC_01221]|uniref:hypothetical protein n=1 Tax=unclassified Streptomyces TaxID=2593676 RepID=UPI00225A0014|nr:MULTISPECIES: hypothetical protein [unclassified Streptomyces]MCX4789010.1 hypothetical protein [Streptomyces sp. NBC_01221]MCX4795245.1 hypothetical protein [Streptomyces sp. NBC_01242]WSP57198.1 hypothetical protein OG306_24580 [Streptomyces sp. NBC_01241]WSU22084.1 hypothetical protein OG508_14650 [Streptomyces sp. NBC_01108]